ncbi:hypothetical protein HYU19_01800 [Candidatus Woesearchaeota archaeon]|nr:hypothetical protein [Candidatus Woesearchaeota archaeon]
MDTASKLFIIFTLLLCSLVLIAASHRTLPTPPPSPLGIPEEPAVPGEDYPEEPLAPGEDYPSEPGAPDGSTLPDEPGAPGGDTLPYDPDGPGMLDGGDGGDIDGAGGEDGAVGHGGEDIGAGSDAITYNREASVPLSGREAGFQGGNAGGAAGGGGSGGSSGGSRGTQGGTNATPPPGSGANHGIAGIPSSKLPPGTAGKPPVQEEPVQAVASWWWIIPASFLILLLIAFLLWLRWYKPKKKAQQAWQPASTRPASNSDDCKKIRDYLAVNMAKGYPVQALKDALVQQGFSSDDVQMIAGNLQKPMQPPLPKQ